MQRTPEPELMTGAEQVLVYAVPFEKSSSLFSRLALVRVP